LLRAHRRFDFQGFALSSPPIASPAALRICALLSSHLYLSIDPTWQIFTPWLNFLQLIGFQIGYNVHELNILIIWTLFAMSFPLAFLLGWIIERLFRLTLLRRGAAPQADEQQ